MRLALILVALGVPVGAHFGESGFRGLCPGAMESSAAYAQTVRDDAGSARAFLEASQVFFNPRCVNCHPVGDAPLQGNQGAPHAMSVKRGPDGQGKAGARCEGCHQSSNLKGRHLPPGAKDWGMPSAGMRMVFEKRTPGQLCRQLKDPEQNGGRTPEQIIEHLKTPLVVWGWNPGEGRAAVPMTYDAFLGKMVEWVQKGASCPE
ncbi:MAG: hypothetical protein ABSC19_10055 [Syntrophorhabdales bacterium]|jgi:hypothetical protein